ncbi:MAG: GtrA family protein [Alphaproteobacteria bacterium]|nr:GtrA family protein [Alphaproteobacteria bacterium]
MNSQPRILGKAPRFLSTGMIVNGTLFMLLALLLHLQWNYLLAATTTYILGMVWGYLQNRFWSWKSDAPLIKSFVAYLAVYGAVYFLHMVAVWSLVSAFSLPPLWAALVSTVLLVAPMYLLLDRFVFVPGASQPDA